MQDVLRVEGADGIIRSVIQYQSEHASYLFAGSSPSLMTRLFANPSRPLLEHALPDREAFKPGKSQRRCWRKNVESIRATFDEPQADDESYALYRRYLHGRRGGEVADGLLAIGVIGACSLGLWAISGLPFGLGPVSLVRFYQDSASVYPVTSANALNLWGAIGFWRNDSMGENVLTIAGVSALHVAWLLFLAGVVVVLWRAHRAIDARHRDRHGAVKSTQAATSQCSSLEVAG